MLFTAPLWLLLLIPWLAALAWALLGRVDFARVPAVFLWQAGTVEVSRRREIRRPPAWAIWLLAAALLAILAAADTRIAWPWGGRPAIVIVDCGPSMSAKGRMADALSTADLGPVRVICVPGDTFWSPRGVPIGRLAFTAVATEALLDRTLRQVLAEERGTVYVVTDQPIAIADDRVRAIRPTRGLENVGIAHFALTEHPGGVRAMIRVKNDSARSAARLVVDRVEKDIKLPSRELAEDFFVDLPAVGSAATVRLDVEDDLPLDNTAWVAQQKAWPRLEARSPLPPAMRRMIDVYTRQRPPGLTSQAVAIVEGFFNLPGGTPAVAMAPMGGGQPLAAGQRVRVEFGHPLTRDVDWPRLIAGGRAYAAPGDGWEPLVTQGRQVLVAVRESDAGMRQVWVGIDIADLALRPDFVVFLTNVFDWLGEAAGEYEAAPVGTLGPAYTPLVQSDPSLSDSPGLYRRSDGALRATHATPPSAAAASGTPPPAQAAAADRFAAAAGMLILGALGCTAMGVLRLTRI